MLWYSPPSDSFELWIMMRVEVIVMLVYNTKWLCWLECDLLILNILWTNWEVLHLCTLVSEVSASSDMPLYPLFVLGQSDHDPGLVSLPTPDAPADHPGQVPGGVCPPGELHTQRPAWVPVTGVPASLKIETLTWSQLLGWHATPGGSRRTWICRGYTGGGRPACRATHTVCCSLLAPPAGAGRGPGSRLTWSQVTGTRTLQGGSYLGEWDPSQWSIPEPRL